MSGRQLFVLQTTYRILSKILFNMPRSDRLRGELDDVCWSLQLPSPNLIALHSRKRPSRFPSRWWYCLTSRLELHPPLTNYGSGTIYHTAFAVCTVLARPMSILDSDIRRRLPLNDGASPYLGRLQLTDTLAAYEAANSVLFTYQTSDLRISM